LVAQWRLLLMNEQGDTTIAAQHMAEDFNRYFASVFTIENMSSLPTADTFYMALTRTSYGIYPLINNKH